MVRKDDRMADWFEKGLKFECTKCGKCCRGEPGHVWVSGAEMVSIAGFLGMSLDVLEFECSRKVGARIGLLEKPNGDCVFWENGIGCRVYPVRPVQCRTFPFWKASIVSPQAWSRVSERCEGVGRGKLYRAEEIRKRAERVW